MNGRAVVEFFLDESLKALNHLRRNVRIELDDDAAIVGRLDDCDLRIGRRLDARLDVAADGCTAVRSFVSCIGISLVASGERKN